MKKGRERAQNETSKVSRFKTSDLVGEDIHLEQLTRRYNVNRNLSRGFKINIKFNENEQNTIECSFCYTKNITRQEPSLENEHEKKIEISSPLLIMISLSW